MEGDDTWKGDVEHVQYFEEGCQHDAFLALFQTSSAKRSLDYILVGCPEVEIVNEHPCEEDRERYSIGNVTYGIENLRVLRENSLGPFDKVVVTHLIDADNKNKRPSNQKSNSV